MKRLLLATVFVLAALEAVYLLGTNIFLNSRYAGRVMNRRPQRFEIRWRSAWSLWPGMVALRGVETRGQSRTIDWYAHLDSVDATFQLLPFANRTVHLNTVRATGVDYRQRRIQRTGMAARVPVADLPGMPGVFDAARAARQAAEEPKPPSGGGRREPPHGPAWTVVAERIVCDIDELWFDRFRLGGPMRLETPMALIVRGPMEFSRIRLTMSQGDLLAGKKKIFADLSLDIDARLHPFVPRASKGLAFFRNLSGRFDLRSHSASLFFLDAYFRTTPWVHFNNRADARVTFLLDHGRMRPGTSLSIDNEHADMQILDRRILGHGVIAGHVDMVGGEPQSTITATLHEFDVVPLDGDVPFAHGRDAVLQATSRTPDFCNPFTDVRVMFDLPEGHLLDVAFYNHLIPEGSSFRLVSGTGTLKYHLEGSRAERGLHGTIDLAIHDGQATFKTARLRGDLAVRTLLRQASAKDRYFDISGTRLELSTKNPRWSAVITLPRARMLFTNPAAADAVVALSMQDTRPIVEIFDAAKGLSDFMKGMMTIENVRGGAVLRSENGRVVVSDLDISGDKLHALADLTMGDKGREGILYIRYKIFSVGIRLLPDGHDLKIWRPKKWFEEERAARRAARPAQPLEAPQPKDTDKDQDD